MREKGLLVLFIYLVIRIPASADVKYYLPIINLEFLSSYTPFHVYQAVLSKKLHQHYVLDNGLMEFIVSYNDSTVNVLIECAVEDSIKYEYSATVHSVIPDSIDGYVRIIALPFPCYYGFTELFTSEDGDFLDAFVFTNTNPDRGVYVTCRPRYLILMKDNGDEDSKLVCTQDNAYVDIDAIEYFLLNYSEDKIIIDDIIDLNLSAKSFELLILQYQKYNN